MTNNVLKSHNLFCMIILCPSIKITAILRTYATWQYIMCWLIQADLTLMTFRPNLGIKINIQKNWGPQLCFRPLECAYGLQSSVGIIPLGR